jgi:hypothetical protein
MFRMRALERRQARRRIGSFGRTLELQRRTALNFEVRKVSSNRTEFVAFLYATELQTASLSWKDFASGNAKQEVCSG